jgi:hypothetical protein
MPSPEAPPAAPSPGARGRVGHWLRRYLPLEIAATATALVGGLAAAALTSNTGAIAFAGTWAENVGYYGFALAREMRTSAAETPELGAGTRLWQALRRLVWEFGIAEALDSFVVRPGAMYAAIKLTGSTGAGIVIGKLVADVAFYAVAIVFYEWGKRARPGR